MRNLLTLARRRPKSPSLPPAAPADLLRFVGYAAIFDEIDSLGDVVRAGAFARTLRHGPSCIPLLWHHEPGRPVGILESIVEDEIGLRVVGRLTADPHAARAVRDGLRGLSFGYRVRHAQMRSGGIVRELLDVDLIEISLTTVAAQPFARIMRLLVGTVGGVPIPVGEMQFTRGDPS